MAAVYDDNRTKYAMSRIPMRTADTSGTPDRRLKSNVSLYQLEYRQAQKREIMKLSPLQKLQMEYQEKLQLEKERKMTSLYEKWSEEALKRVENHSGKRNPKPGGVVRNNQLVASGAKEGPAPTGYSLYQKRLAASAQERMKQRKPQKLPPINNVSKANSFHAQDSQKTDGSSATRRVRYGHPISNPNLVEEEPQNLEDPSMQDEGHSSPPPNIQHLRLLRERRQQQKQLMRLEKQLQLKVNPEEQSFKTRRKMTDFEKWQQQQDAERMERLQKHYSTQEVPNQPTIPQKFSPQVIPNRPNARPGRAAAETAHNSMKHNALNKTFVANNNTLSAKRSMSPNARRQVSYPTRRQEVLQQGMENERRILELEREMKQKQIDLKVIQEREKRSRLDSFGNAASGSENDSDHDIRFASSQSHTPILKPVKVMSKKLGQSNHSIFSTEEDDSNNSEMGFQMKPVLVRRDGSRGSNRSASTPQKDKTYVIQKPQKIKHNPRTRTFMSPNLKIHEEDENKNHLVASPPLHPVQESSTENIGYRLDNIETEEDVVLNLVPCKICKRKFNQDRLAKHTKVCSQSKGKRRKVFDMSKARTQGTDAAKYVGRIKYTEPPKERKSNWRQKHEEFITNIRNAKIAQQYVAQGGKLSDLPPPPPSQNLDYVKCQYCERKFDPAVAERHIPRCKDIKSRPKPPKQRR